MRPIVTIIFLFFVVKAGFAQDLNWNTYPEGEYNATYTNIGNKPVNAIVEVSGSTGSFYIDYPRPSTYGLELNANFPQNGDCITTKITFSEAVSNVAFTLFDIDRIDGDSQYQDQVTVTGSNGGTSVSPVLGPSVTTTISGNVITGINSSVENATNAVSFGSPVTEIVIQYCAGPDFVDPKRQYIHISNFSWDDAAPFPVRLVSFGASKKENNINLRWSTAMETSSARFEIERAGDAKEWHRIGEILARGESNSKIDYDFLDVNPLSGSNFYRLKMVDLDESFTYSSMRQISWSDDFDVRVYPNPGTNFIKISGHEKISSVKILNANGVKVYENVKLSSDQIDINRLQPGVVTMLLYLFDGTIQTRKIAIYK